MDKVNPNFSLMRMLAFFIPLGFSASLTSITHVIINGTLGRADHAEIIIANYAIALSLFGIIERPVLVFRQTCSALVKGQASFQVLFSVFVRVTIAIFLVCALIGFTPLGNWIFLTLFDADPASLNQLFSSFRIIALVILFSGMRCLYQGIIINHYETKWITAGVIFRLAGMLIISFSLVHFDLVKSSSAGALIFLTGMVIECGFSVWRGRSILAEQGEIEEPELKKKEIYSFYTPLVFYLSFQTIIIPIIYAFLGKIENVHMGIASFALAFSITNLVLSFFMYTHQLVLQFFKNNRSTVIECVIVFSLVPSLLLCVLCFTPAGLWFMSHIMGTNEALGQECLSVLKYFIIKTLVFPWVDFLGGILMLQKSTRSMLKPQVLNIITVCVLIVPLVYYLPDLNGRAGAIAASIGELAGLLAVYQVVRKVLQRKKPQTEISENF
ncbi:multi antimicrobial extrusion protein MatE [Fictibacillus fluitans]|uniref:Multi antimicrobial extrusion protein MatE n=1 Tax=Fictibacillus fluitans TaxID=3058422 RepID=A0ABT8HTR7_9BACL|nr:multi antimicrobial extrusion protein MatE [Fictibacillus sp. NE201]MDN4524172.1 multi antimicrobial extrusion protein MatE [Fictibacillus sp. NE201]